MPSAIFSLARCLLPTPVSLALPTLLYRRARRVVSSPPGKVSLAQLVKMAWTSRSGRDPPRVRKSVAILTLGSKPTWTSLLAR